jgi:peptidoglycan-associated lipoprotein
MRRVDATAAFLLLLVMTCLGLAACGGKKPPIARPTPPPPATAPAATATARPPTPPEPVAEPTVVPQEPVRADTISSAALDDLNRSSPLKPAFFDLDSSELTVAGRAALDEDAATLKRNTSWVITIEGHCDERGTAEYNLALGERRAVTARSYLVSLGVTPDRLRTVSYGKEFPFEAGHDEGAYTKNRRAHFVITAK